MSDSGYTVDEIREMRRQVVTGEPLLERLSRLEAFEAVIREDQAERDIAIVNQLYPLGSEVLGNAPTVIAVALRSQSFTGTESNNV